MPQSSCPTRRWPRACPTRGSGVHSENVTATPRILSDYTAREFCQQPQLLPAVLTRQGAVYLADLDVDLIYDHDWLLASADAPQMAILELASLTPDR